MMGARDAQALLTQAKAEGARLVLVEDVQQLGSAEGGRIIEQPDTQTRQANFARDFARRPATSGPERWCSPPPPLSDAMVV
jgi:hypothetical protein